MYITYIIMAVTIALSFYAWKQPSVMAKFIFNPYMAQRRNEFHRFITSGFIHQDHMHLLLNMFSFYFFGLAVETVFAGIFGSAGSLMFILLYLAAIVVSEIPTYLKHKNNPGYNSLGASGGVAAIIFAFIIFRPVDNIYLYFIPIPGFILGTLYIVFSWYQGRKSNDNINHDAHLYGALFGFVFCIIAYPKSISNFIYQIKNWEVFN